MNPRSIRYALSIVVPAIFLTANAHAQPLNEPEPWEAAQSASPGNSAFSWEGNATLSAETLGASARTGGRLPATAHAGVTARFEFGENLEIPIEIYAQAAPEAYGGTSAEIGAHPRLFGWLTLHAGYHHIALSPLTIADASLNGYGVEISPGALRAFAFHGRQRSAAARLGASPADTVAAAYERIGETPYDRTFTAASVGYDDDRGGTFSLRLARVVDDSISVEPPLRTSPATENTAVSVAFSMMPIDDVLRVRGEAAVAAFTSDMTSREITGAPGAAGIFTPRYTSRFDGAASASAEITPLREARLALSARWVGPGYRAPGTPFLENDLMEATASPSLALFDGDLRIDGTYGLRLNNLLGQRTSTTQRILASTAISTQLNETFGLDASYTNFGTAAVQGHDTFPAGGTAHSFTISPRARFTAFDAQHNVGAAYTTDDDRQTRIGERTSTNTTARTLQLFWLASYPSSLTLGFTAFHTTFDGTGLGSRTTSFGPSAGYTILGGDLEGKLALEQCTSAIADVRETSGRATVSIDYRPWERGTLSLRLVARLYGTPGTNDNVGSLVYSIGF